MYGLFIIQDIDIYSKHNNIDKFPFSFLCVLWLVLLFKLFTLYLMAL